MYRAADAEFDVPTCYRVLQTIGGQRALLVRHRDQRGQPTERRQAITRLIEVHDALQQYYEARCAFAGDLAKSAHALEREFMKEEWDRIQRINTTSSASINTLEKEWIIDLTAQGGMGKTIFLQWLASRKCVPNRVPYARIDFDFTDPTVLPEAPWLVLVRLAEQLNTQIAGRPFSGFIERYDEYASIARDLAVEGRAQHTGEILDVTGEQRLGRQVTDDFADTLRDTVGGAVVIVLDTIEDVIRRRTTNLLAVITCLANVHDAYPNLRLVLAGRFDLRDDTKLKGFNAAFGPVTREVEVHRFDVEESVNYLVAVRGLPDGDAVRAMAEASRGLPFALSLYADEWQLGGAMTAEQVRASPNPELKYLVNRVLRRIEASDQALCWLLRYGVVPRQLTKSFAKDVLLPEMESALGGESKHDDPSRDADPLHPFYAAPRTRPAPVLLNMDDLWARLEAYTSTLSFVRADADRDTVVFHEDAVRPMRRELQRQPVYRPAAAASGVVLRARRARGREPGSGPLGSRDPRHAVPQVPARRARMPNDRGAARCVRRAPRTTCGSCSTSRRSSRSPSISTTIVAPSFATTGRPWCPRSCCETRCSRRHDPRCSSAARPAALATSTGGRKPNVPSTISTRSNAATRHWRSIAAPWRCFAHRSTRGTATPAMPSSGSRKCAPP
jgi:hypothetical protein